jgi:hypothetical protein
MVKSWSVVNERSRGRIQRPDGLGHLSIVQIVRARGKALIAALAAYHWRFNCPFKSSDPPTRLVATQWPSTAIDH